MDHQWPHESPNVHEVKWQAYENPASLSLYEKNVYKVENEKVDKDKGSFKDVENISNKFYRWK